MGTQELSSFPYPKSQVTLPLADTGTADALRRRTGWQGGGQSVFPACVQNLEEAGGLSMGMSGSGGGKHCKRHPHRGVARGPRRNTLQSLTINLRGQGLSG